MVNEDRLITSQTISNDAPDHALRPKYLADMIGQDNLRAKLQILVDAARKRGDALDHVLLYGPPGLGKTSSALALANEMNVNIKSTAGPAIERAGDLAAILAGMHSGDILFIDEIHRLNRTVEEILYPAMEDFQLQLVVGSGSDTKTLVVRLPKFTVIGATTRLALLSSPLRARFGVVERFDFYTQDAIRRIVIRAATMIDTQLTEDGAQAIATRSRGTPRVALRLLRRLRDFAQVRADGEITAEVAEQAMLLLGVDGLGLDELDHRVLDALINKFKGNPVGLATLAAAISEEEDTIMDVVEPYLLQLGFLERTPRGRIPTLAANDHFTALGKVT